MKFMVRSRVAVALGALLLVCPAAWAQDDVPLVSGNMEIAHKFLHGDAHVLLMGDSIQNGLIGAYPKHWKVDKWVGQVVGPNLGQSYAGNTGAWGIMLNNPPQPFVDMNTSYLPDVPPPGLAGYAPGAVHYVSFNGQQAGQGGLLANRFIEFGLASGQDQIYSSGKWADRSDGQINVDVILYGNPQGIASGAELALRTNSITTPDLTVPLNARSVQGQIVTYSGSFPAHSWDPGAPLAGSFRLTPGATPEAGSNLPILGMRIYTGEKGFQLADIAWGGRGINYYLNPANTTDKNLKDYLYATDSNTAFIWLGQNDMGPDSPAVWKAKMQQLISRYKTARPDMDFVLVSTFDTDPDPSDGILAAGYARVLHEIAQSDPDVLFLNLYRAAGDFSFLNANYLEDGVHPSLAGLDYFAGITQDLLALADSQVPEPTGAVAAGAVVAACVLRRRRRA
jgi:MYXO-CTERM domain-containing protein